MKKVIQNWLNIIPASEQSIVLMENMTFNTEVLRAQIWYRGDADEIYQFFKRLNRYGAKSAFWESVPKKDKIRKIHSGLPAIIADTLAYIVYSDMDDLKFNGKGKNDWDEIINQDKGNLNFIQLIANSIVDTLVDGDGAFKISVDTDISPYPIVDFIGADKVEYERQRGIITAIIFKTVYTVKSKRYILRERYGKGIIESRLYDDNGNEKPLNTIEELEKIPSVVEFNGDYIMAVPLKFFNNKKHKGRGKSIFDGGKSDCFDALDEVISQWWDAIRSGRVNKYIPQDMIPTDPKTGEFMSVDSFGTDFITVASINSETLSERSKIEVVQPDIKYDAFVSSYTNCLLMCLQGLVSPATLGIDVGKMQSADAQREKKDVTGNTRNTITTALEKAIPQLVSAILKTYDNMQEKAPQEYDVTVSFGEYGAPDFDSRVETIGKASTYGIMSVKTQVDELWGSSKEDDWKKSEVERIKREKGLIEGEPPAVGDELA